MTTPANDFRPPFMAFATFWNFIADLGSRPLPPQIDRSIMASKSGTDQNNLIAALTGFDLIDSNNRVQPALEQLAAKEPDDRKTALANLVRKYYGPAVALSENHGTHQQLQDVFKDQLGLDGSADTRRKAITFFLHALRTADLPVSANFPATRSGSGGPGVGKKRAKAPRAQTPKPTDPIAEPLVPPPATTAFSTQVRLKAGTVRLTVDVNPIELRGADRAFFYDLVDKIEDYAAANPSPPVHGAAPEDDREGGVS